MKRLYYEFEKKLTDTLRVDRKFTRVILLLQVIANNHELANPNNHAVGYSWVFNRSNHDAREKRDCSLKDIPDHR